uniref:Sey1/RHD3-like three-helix bundle domain-containing protein n=1 Tax=Rhodosorus marinus TaxID=101924 RepID=A0A7S2ZJC4_9RHOD|mmetsp:Transcript_21487/g.87687  ORF Transcript_21487/g.87687 Transcript_21487/m.87687 type:complete len:542 (+) Transcript_21487:126-1751(+)|eukprot:CAMPEP_0113966754 /NCGR_PEP_ID=MMETSP0011_2-20120614/8496_1 /TAXON_ID=101924 /ORGANISM="Rhodosorus marinus" /LENGTH=541 /DNA_ID=CAMNT_0000979453 /DNA_START=44 /DNA_END=1669 /DNA_ORIENTATION=+ /assembly_acc=CAM_ASM_000156
MGWSEVVSKNGKLNESRLKGLMKGLPKKFSVISSLGPCSSGKSSVLNDLILSDFPVGSIARSQTTLGINGVGVPGKDLMILSSPPRGLLVLDVEGADSKDLQRKMPQKLAASFAITIADVVLVSFNMRDIGRLESSGISYLFQAIEENLQLRSERVVVPKKQLLVTVIRDFDEEEISRQNAIAAVMTDFRNALNTISRPTGYVATRLTDLFEFEFVTLSNKNLFPEKFDSEASALRARLVNPLEEEYLFENSDFQNALDASEFPKDAARLWKVLSENAKSRPLPDEEVAANFKCDQSYKEAYKQYNVKAKAWSDRAQRDERVIANFGRESDALVANTLEEYSQLASDYRGTKAYDRKHMELKETMLSELGLIYAKQISLVMEVLFESFCSNLNRLHVTSQLEKVIDSVVREVEKTFVRRAEEMRCKASKWRYDGAKQMFVSSLREVSTERVQIARLEGSYIPGLRAPVNFTVHYLNPSVRPEDFTIGNLIGDRPERMITVPQRARRDRSLKAERGRMYAHQEANFNSKAGETTSFDLQSPF